MKKYLLYNPTNGEWNSDPMTLDEIRALTPGAEETYVAELLEDGTTGPTITLAPAAPRPKLPPMQRNILETPKPATATLTSEQHQTYRLLRIFCRLFILTTCISVLLGCVSLGASITGNITGMIIGAIGGIGIILIGRAFLTD